MSVVGAHVTDKPDKPDKDEDRHTYPHTNTHTNTNIHTHSHKHTRWYKFPRGPRFETHQLYLKSFLKRLKRSKREIISMPYFKKESKLDGTNLRGI